MSWPVCVVAVPSAFPEASEVDVVGHFHPGYPFCPFVPELSFGDQLEGIALAFRERYVVNFVGYHDVVVDYVGY
jgi:hypothetical protein